MITAGIDPGVTGAVAFYDPGRTVGSGLRWNIFNMPVMFNKSGMKQELNAAWLRDLLRKFSPHRVYLEHVTAMPSGAERRGMGAASAFQFGGMFFGIKAVVACCDIPLELVVPVVWKKHHGLKGSNKERSRQLAIKLFPEASLSLQRKKDENRAEAMLIAAYGQSKN